MLLVLLLGLLAWLFVVDSALFASPRRPTPAFELAAVDLHCRIVLGVPKSGTTWLMQLLWTYLTLSADLDDARHPSFAWAFGHVKRADAACQYDTGDKRRALQRRLEHAYAVLPAFSHGVVNHNVSGPAESFAAELEELQRFFGLRMDIDRHVPPNASTGVRFGQRFFDSAPSRHHHDQHCDVLVILRSALPVAASCCHYYRLCAKASNFLDVPSDEPHSLMVPLNATLRWRAAVASLLEKATLEPRKPAHATTCPAIPFGSDSPKGRSLRLNRVRVMTFEALRRHTADELRRALRFFDIPVDDALVREAIAAVAARPGSELKKGLTAGNSLDRFTTEQRRYVDELTRSNDPLQGVLEVVDQEPQPANDTDASIDEIVDVGNGGALVVQVGRERASFRVCDSFKGALIAHAVDRVLGLACVPDTVPCVVDVAELSRAPSVNETALADVGRACQNGRTIWHGSLTLGAPKQRAVILPAEFDPRNVSSDAVELSRLAISAFVNGQALKSTLAGSLRTFVANVDFADAQWRRFDAAELTLKHDEKPTCLRAPRSESPFACNHWAHADARNIVSFLQTACVFPLEIVERLASAEPPSARVRALIVEQQRVSRAFVDANFGSAIVGSAFPEQWPLVSTIWNARVLDQRVAVIAKAVSHCAKSTQRP